MNRILKALFLLSLIFVVHSFMSTDRGPRALTPETSDSRQPLFADIANFGTLNLAHHQVQHIHERAERKQKVSKRMARKGLKKRGKGPAKSAKKGKLAKNPKAPKGQKDKKKAKQKKLAKKKEEKKDEEKSPESSDEGEAIAQNDNFDDVNENSDPVGGPYIDGPVAVAAPPVAEDEPEAAEDLEDLLEDWRSKIFATPDLLVTGEFVRGFISGDINERIFFTLVDEMLAAEKQFQDLAFVAIRNAPTARSFRLLVDLSSTDEFADSALTSLQSYASTQYVGILKEALEDDDDAVSQFALDSITQIVSNLNDGGARNVAGNGRGIREFALSDDPADLVTVLPTLEDLCDNNFSDACGPIDDIKSFVSN